MSRHGSEKTDAYRLITTAEGPGATRLKQYHYSAAGLIATVMRQCLLPRLDPYLNPIELFSNDLEQHAPDLP